VRCLATGMMQLERELRLKDLIAALKNDHEEIRRRIWILHTLVSRGTDADFNIVEKRTIELGTLLGAHFAKEESRTRDVLAASQSISYSSISDNTIAFSKSGVVGSTIQKHKAMADSFREIYGLAAVLTREEKLSVFEKFERVLLLYLKEEEDKDLFPFLIGQIDENQKIAQPQDDKQGQRKSVSGDGQKSSGEKDGGHEELVLA